MPSCDYTTRFSPAPNATRSKPALPRVLAIAGTDPSGGAGLQADIKTITALGGYAQGAITALLAQNTLGVQSVVKVSERFVADQIRVCLDDIGVDAIKIGMLHRAAVIERVAEALSGLPDGVPIVLDPVMVAKSGHRLLDPEAEAALADRMLPRAAVLTPNAPEAAVLTGQAIENEDDMRRAGDRLLRTGAGAVLMKGGHLDGPEVLDLLMTRDETTEFRHPRLTTRSTHGTGCTLSAALATALASGHDLRAAAATAVRYVHEALRTAPGFGGGAGPLNHLHTIIDTREAARPKVGVGAVIYNDAGQVLLHRRRFGDGWAPVSGHVEPGESLREAFHREVLEETGLTVRIDRLVSINSDPSFQTVDYPDGRRVQFVTALFASRVTGGALHGSDEGTEWGWYAPDEMPDPLLPYAKVWLADTASDASSGPIIR